MSKIQDIVVEYTSRIDNALLTDGSMDYFKGHEVKLADKGNAPTKLPYIKTVINTFAMEPYNTNDNVFKVELRSYIYSKKSEGYKTKSAGAIFDFEKLTNVIFTEHDFGGLCSNVDSITGKIIEETDEYVQTEVVMTVTSNEFRPSKL